MKHKGGIRAWALPALLLILLLSIISQPIFTFNAFAKKPHYSKLKKKHPAKKHIKYKKQTHKKYKGKKSHYTKYGRHRYKTRFAIELDKDTVLTDGVKYRHYYFVRGRVKNSVHVLVADLSNPNIDVAVLKAKNQAFELEKLHDMIRTFDSLSHNEVIGAVNGNFWRAYSNTPIGPTVVNGEVVEMKTHKRWSSGFFDEYSRLFIDNFFMDGAIFLKDGKKIHIDNVNHRNDSLGIVLYNHFGGDTIPYITKKELNKALANAFETAIESALQDTVFADSSEMQFDTVSLKYNLTLTNRLMKVEHSLTKVSLRYIDNPIINEKVRCRVLSIDTGSVPMPDDGCIISFGYEIPKDLVPKINDTIEIKFSTNVKSNIHFFNSVSGTPRLVRNGRAHHEAYEEGSRGRRFISRELSRTAIGTDRSLSKVFLVAAEPTSRDLGIIGANLRELAGIMRQIGAYNAMNLDGGGSSLMVIDNKNVFYKSRPDLSRKLAVGVAIYKRKNSEGSE